MTSTRSNSPIILVAQPGAGLGALYELLGTARSLTRLDSAARDTVREFFVELQGTQPTLAAHLATQENVEKLNHLLQSLTPTGKRAPRLLLAGPGYVRRIAFLAQAFPKAQFVYLHRAPTDSQNQAPWAAGTRRALRDLEALPAHRWCAVNYDDLIADPADEAYWLGEFAGLRRSTYAAGPAMRRHQAEAGCRAAVALTPATQKVANEAQRIIQARHPSWTLLAPPRRAAARTLSQVTASHRFAAGLCLGAAVLPTVAHAGSFIVSNTDDSGTGSLRDAIGQANTAGGTNTITFEASVTGTLALSGGNILITSAVDIQGPDPAVLTIDAGGTSRVFYAKRYTGAIHNPNVIISGLTLQNGGNVENGGAVFSSDVNLWLDNVVVQNCNAIHGGAVFAAGNGNQTIAITRSTITHNNAATNGAGGGIVVPGDANVLISDTIVSNNSGPRGGGIFAYASENVAIEGSTISGNSSSDGGGGIYIAAQTIDVGTTAITGNKSDVGAAFASAMTGVIHAAGGAFLHASNIAVHDTTVSGNQAGEGSGGLTTYGAVSIVNTTIANNTGEVAGGLYTEGSLAQSINFTTIAGNASVNGAGGIFNGHAPVLLANSIVANNSANNPNNISQGSTGTFDIGFSVLDNPNGIALTGNANNVVGNPQLAALANNGGTLQTMLPGSTSPALAAADPQAAANEGLPATDERGVARPTTTRADVGAVQLERCGSVVEGASCTCTNSCITACTCSAMGTCSGTPAADGTSCTEVTNGTCQSGTCTATHSGTTTGGTTTTTGGTTTGGSTTGGTTAGATTAGVTTGTTTSGSGTGTSSSSKKSGCAATPVEGAAPLAFSLLGGLVARWRRRKAS